jgi:pseudomonalisin
MPVGRRARMAVAVASALSIGCATAAVSASASTPVVLQLLRGDVLPGAASLPDLGPTNGQSLVDIGITLARPNEAAEITAYRAMYDPGSESYRHFYSPRDFARAFGVDATRTDAVERWLSRGGLRIVETSAAGDYVFARGRVERVNALLHVQLRDYRLGHRIVYGVANGPSVPAALGVEGVLGLTDALGMRPNSQAAVAPAAKPDQDGCFPVVNCTGHTSPQDLWSTYHMPATATGKGQRIAIFGEGQISQVLANLKTFESMHKLPRVPVRFVSVGDDFKDNSAAEEWDLDSQASTAMAPNVRQLTFYFTKSLLDPDVEAEFSKWVSDPHGPLQANASFGECEEAPGMSAVAAATNYTYGSASDMFRSAAERTLRQATMEGRTLFSSTGDTGGSCYFGAGVNGVTNTAVPLISYPAGSPYVVAVGGTVLFGSGGNRPARSNEFSWHYTGGGSSAFIAQPSYQAGVATISGDSTVSPYCAARPDGTPYGGAQTCRVVPDIAAQSGMLVNNGFGIVSGGSNDAGGAGTSLSSPLCVGMWARIQGAASMKARSRHGLGFANPSFYRIAKAARTGAGEDFFDVGGASASAPSTNGQFISAPRTPVDPTGYDPLAGLGVPDVGNLIRHLLS